MTTTNQTTNNVTYTSWTIPCEVTATSNGGGSMGGYIGGYTDGYISNLQNITNEVWNGPADENAWYRTAQAQLESIEKGDEELDEAFEKMAEEAATEPVVEPEVPVLIEFPHYSEICTKTGIAACKQFEEVGAEVDTVHSRGVGVFKYLEPEGIRLSFTFDADKEWTTAELVKYLNILLGKKLKW